MNSGRELLSFSTVSMAPREAMLLKSFMRILDGRTRQRWLFKPHHDNHEQQGADLIFLGEEGVEAPASSDHSPTGRKLRMGVLSLDVVVSLGWPLRPDELEDKLNRMGKMLVQARATSNLRGNSNFFSSSIGDKNLATGQPTHLWRPVAEGSTHSEFAPSTAFASELIATVPASLKEKSRVSPDAAATCLPAPPASAAPAGMPAIALDDKLRLVRWPLASLINTPPRLKLAALMTCGSNTLGNLQKTSGQTLSACSQFVEDLRQHGFLAVEAAKPRRFVEPALQQAASELPATAPTPLLAPEKKPRAAVALPGLFARIRARLGISPAH